MIATIVIGFSWGGWVTGGTADHAPAWPATARELASAICVERFNAAPDAAAKLAEFKAIPDSYKKRQFVEAGGWATMPGQTTADRPRSKAVSPGLAHNTRLALRPAPGRFHRHRKELQQ